MLKARTSLLPALLAAIALPVVAAPLDKEACEKLKADHAAAATPREHLAKGPDWAKANLSKEQLKEVERYIDMEEQIAFRCVQRRPVETAAPKAAPKPKVKKAAAKAEPAEGEQAEAAKPAPRRKQPVEAKGEGTGDAGMQKAAAQPARKPAPKPKPADAYVPAPKGSAAAKE